MWTQSLIRAILAAGAAFPRILGHQHTQVNAPLFVAPSLQGGIFRVGAAMLHLTALN